MKISENQLEERTLIEFGLSAAAMLSNGEFEELAKQFGYALAYERDPAKAIAEDLEAVLCDAGTSDSSDPVQVTVKYFEQNDAHLLAVVECLVTVASGGLVLLGLVAARNGQVINLFLEDLNAVA